MAVAVVVAYHLGIHQVRGGLFGVDIFFVLSGYLITGLLIDEWRTRGDVALSRFWGRRARRLLPAVLLMLAVVAVLGRYWLHPEDLPGLRGDILATLFYFANWHAVVAGHGYFAAFASPSPLLHTWSLAVEEQFYVIWPFVAVVTLRRMKSPRRLLVVCVLGAIASVSLMAASAMAGVGNDRLYYGTDTRAQGLLIGAALSCLMWASGRTFLGQPFRRSRAAGSHFHSRLREHHPVAAVAGYIGAAVLVVMCVRVDGQSGWLYRGGFALLALSVAAVVTSVILLPRATLAKLLSLPPLVGLGVISYGVYLWHWPVIVFLTPQRAGVHGNVLLLLRLAVTLGVALASFYLVERPIRAQRWRVPRPLVSVPALMATMAVAVVLAPVPSALGSTMVQLQHAGPPPPPPAAAGTLSASAGEATAGLSTTTTAPGPQVTVPGVSHAGPLRVMIVGDSVAWSLGNGIAPVAAPAGVLFSNQGYVGCGIARGGATSFKSYTQPATCLTWPQRWQSLTDTFRPDVTLVLLGRWEVLDRVHDGQWMHIGEPAFDAYLRSELELVVSTLASHAGRVAFLSAPCNDHALADVASPGRLPPDDDHRVQLLNQMMAGIAAEHPGSTEMVDFAGMVCPGDQFERSRNGIPLRTSDGVHMEPYAGQLFVQQLLPGVATWTRAAQPASPPSDSTTSVSAG